MSNQEALVIIGNGMAPGRMLEHLFAQAPDRFKVTVFNAEPRVNYDRLMLSPVLAGEKRYEDIITHDDARLRPRELRPVTNVGILRQIRCQSYRW